MGAPQPAPRPITFAQPAPAAPRPVQAPVAQPSAQPQIQPQPQTQSASPQPMQFTAPPKPPKPSKKPLLIKLSLIFGSILLIVVAILGIHSFQQGRKPIVPESITSSVKYSVYYPDPKKLPQGFTLDKQSIRSPAQNGVTYTVLYEKTKKIIFNLQAAATDKELATFRSTYIPKRVSYTTPVGDAEVGASGNSLLVSIPVSGGPWIVVTAPGDISQDNLKQVLNTLVKEPTK